MKDKTAAILLGFLIFLFLVAGVFYAKTSALEDEKEALSVEIRKETNINRALKTKYYESFNLGKIYYYATHNLKMTPPSSYIVTEINDGK